MLVGAIVLDVAYWTIWFTNRDWIASEHDEAYYEFENAFPLADLWLGVACLLALLTLRAGRPSALLWLISAGSAGLYLFSMDFLYDVENGIFAKGGGGAFEAVIVALTLLFSVTVLSWSWRHRGELLTGERVSGPPPPG
jgi:surface polysaccharide O-acyltransferase-like enzyme